jgi:hypothetical protein
MALLTELLESHPLGIPLKTATNPIAERDHLASINSPGAINSFARERRGCN